MRLHGTAAKTESQLKLRNEEMMSKKWHEFKTGQLFVCWEGG